MAYDSAGALLSDANQGVFKLKGLWKQVAEGAKDALQKRMAMVDYTRSSMKSVILDAEGEDFSRVATSFAGISDLLDRFMMLLSASTGIPVTILMGRSAAGMNSTGDSDFRAFYDRVAAYQTRVLTPMLLEIYDMAGDAPADLCLEWLPLWEPSEKEQADTKLVEAQVAKTEAEEYQVWITAQVLMPEEVALAEFSDATNGEIEIDVEARKQSLEQETELALNPPEPPVVPPVPGAPVPPGQAPVGANGQTS
jgi:phage-related protein (TIGR01555 family)